MREAGWGPEKIRAARNSEGYQKLLKDVKGYLTETEKTTRRLRQSTGREQMPAEQTFAAVGRSDE